MSISKYVGCGAGAIVQVPGRYVKSRERSERGEGLGWYECRQGLEGRGAEPGDRGPRPMHAIQGSLMVEVGAGRAL